MIDEIFGVKRGDQSESGCSESSDIDISVLESAVSEMLCDGDEIVLEGGYEGSDFQVAIRGVGEGEVVSLAQDLDAGREGALSTNVFLEGGGCGSSAIDLFVEETDQNQIATQLSDKLLQQRRLVSASQSPTTIASTVSYVSAHRIGSSSLLVQ